MAGSERVRSKASRYKRFVLHQPDSQRLNETFVTQAQVRVEGVPDPPPLPSPPPTPTRLGQGHVRSSQVSQVELGTAQTKQCVEEGGRLPQLLGRGASGGKWRSEWLPGRQKVALQELCCRLRWRGRLTGPTR